MIKFMIFNDGDVIYDTSWKVITHHSIDVDDMIDNDVKDYESIDDISDAMDRMIEFFSDEYEDNEYEDDEYEDEEGEEEDEAEEKDKTEQDHSSVEQKSSSNQCNDEVISSDTQYHFNFPKMLCPSIGSQVDKIFEETNEILEAVNLYTGDSYSRMKIMEETLDCIHACETFLNELASSEDEINVVKDHVLHKNMRRGYYDEDAPLDE